MKNYAERNASEQLQASILLDLNLIRPLHCIALLPNNSVALYLANCITEMFKRDASGNIVRKVRCQSLILI